MAKSKLSSFATIFKYGVVLFCVLAVIYFVKSCINGTEKEEITLKPTPLIIESVKPIGQLYAYTAFTEEYDNYFMEDPGIVSFFNDNIGTILTLRAQVSFIMDLDSVHYETSEDSDTVLVRLPKLRFEMSRQKSNLFGGTDRSNNYNSNLRFDVIENRINVNYNTKANYDKAMENVKAVLGAFVSQFDKVPKFEEIN